MAISNKYIITLVVLLLLIIGDKNLLLIANLIALIYFLMIGEIQKKTVILFIFLLIPVILPAIYGIYYYPIYDVLKDIYYLLNPALFIILGIVIARIIGLKVFFQTIVIVGSIYSIFHITLVFLNFGISAFYDFRQVRIEVGGGHIITTIALILSIFSIYIYKINLFSSHLLVKLFIGLNCLSFLFSGSRTFGIIFIVLMISLMYPYFRRRLMGFVITITISLVVSIMFVKYNPENKLVKSIVNSTTEVTVGDYDDLSDQNDKFRGWETYRAYITYYEGNVFQLLFGHGAGKMIDLGTYFHLSQDDPTETIRYIPILHNGYMYALVKGGIVSIICYLFYFIYIFHFAVKKLKGSNIQINFISFFLIGIIISIYFSNIVISGLYNTTVELLGILCGALLYYLLQFKKVAYKTKFQFKRENRKSTTIDKIMEPT